MIFIIPGGEPYLCYAILLAKRAEQKAKYS
jgi:hypothetical protein